MFRSNFLKLKFWKLLSNSYCPEQLNLENVNLLSNPNVNPKNVATYEKTLHVQKKYKGNKTKTNPINLKLNEGRTVESIKYETIQSQLVL